MSRTCAPAMVPCAAGSSPAALSSITTNVDGRPADVGSPGTALVDPGADGHDQLLFLGDAFMLGASPGLICSGVAAGFAVSSGSDTGVACSVVVAGMHPGRAG